MGLRSSPLLPSGGHVLATVKRRRRAFSNIDDLSRSLPGGRAGRRTSFRRAESGVREQVRCPIFFDQKREGEPGGSPSRALVFLLCGVAWMPPAVHTACAV